MGTKIYYRDSITPEDEKVAIAKYFPGSKIIPDFNKNDLVIGRYSVLPFYRDQEKMLNEDGARLINTTDQHKYIANCQYIHNLGYYTMKTYWSAEEMMNADYDGSFIVKGVTNSKKFNWSTHMFAENKKAAIDVMIRLQQDSLIGEQQIIFREFVKFKQLDKPAGDAPPIINEWRVFAYCGKIIAKGFYWANYPDVKATPPDDEWLNKVIQTVNEAPFIAIDVAETEDGNWLVVEINDGQMAGLSTIDADEFYDNLATVMNKETNRWE